MIAGLLTVISGAQTYAGYMTFLMKALVSCGAGLHIGV